jgi:hypothetical protein
VLLLILSLVRSQSEEVFGMNGLLFGLLIVLAGFALYVASSLFKAK